MTTEKTAAPHGHPARLHWVLLHPPGRCPPKAKERVIPASHTPTASEDRGKKAQEKAFHSIHH